MSQPPLESLAAAARSKACTEVIDALAHPDLLFLNPELLSLSESYCAASVEKRAAESRTAEAVLHELAKIDETLLDRLESPMTELANTIRVRRSARLAWLNQTWRLEGWLEQLRAMGISGIPEALRRDALCLPEPFENPTVIVPDRESPAWLPVALEWARRNPVESGRHLLVVAHPDEGPSVEQIQAALASRLARSQRVSSNIAVLVLPSTRCAEAALMAATRRWVPTGAPLDARVARWADALGVEIEAVPAGEDPSFILPEGRPLRCLAWPRWSEEEMWTLFECVAPLVGSRHMGLVLRHNATMDGPIESGIALLQGVFEALYGSSADLEVHIEDRPMADDDWSGLAASIDLAVGLPSVRLPAGILEAAGRPMVTDAEGVARELGRLVECLGCLKIVHPV